VTEIVGLDPIHVVPGPDTHDVDPVIHGGADVADHIAVLGDRSENTTHVASFAGGIRPGGGTPVSSLCYLPLAKFEADCRRGGHPQVFEARLYRFWKRFQYLGYNLSKYLI
jgi:hypothetical protein